MAKKVEPLPRSNRPVTTTASVLVVPATFYVWSLLPADVAATFIKVLHSCRIVLLMNAARHNIDTTLYILKPCRPNSVATANTLNFKLRSQNPKPQNP